MNGIQRQQYSIGFTALVPKSKYSGTPRLSQNCINEIKKLKMEIKNTDKDILELENQISNPDVSGRVLRYFKQRLALLNKFREKIQNQIDCIRQYNFVDHEDFAFLQYDKNKYLKERDNAFDNAKI